VNLFTFVGLIWMKLSSAFPFFSDILVSLLKEKRNHSKLGVFMIEI